MELPPPNRAALWDLLQSLCGLLLALFLLFHLHLEASILFGEDAFARIAWLLHGGWLDPAGHGYSLAVVAAAGVITLLLLVHALASLRRVPATARQWWQLQRHLGWFRHPGTRLWAIQLLTGLALTLVVPIHLFTMLSQPDNIGVPASSLRIVDHGWLLYGLILPLAVVHTLAGLTRLWLKWHPGGVHRKALAWSATAFALYLMVLGSASLYEQYQYGLAHQADQDTPALSAQKETP